MAGVGPFEETRLDFSDGHGKPHMGPHIIAGVNGSGKSTVLRAIAATVAGAGAHSDVAENTQGFDFEWWGHRLIGWEDSIALSVWAGTRNGQRLCRALVPAKEGADKPTKKARAVTERYGNWWSAKRTVGASLSSVPVTSWVSRPPTNEEALLVGYAPSLALRTTTPIRMASPERLLNGNELSFSGTVDGSAIQLMLQFLRFSVGFEGRKNAESAHLESTLEIIEKTLTGAIGLTVNVEVEPGMQPRLKVILGQQSLNLSQLPDGARNLMGWFMDFILRRDTARWSDSLKSRRPAVLLVDEIDAHLHPRWQRTVLPALAEAFREEAVQIIVTTHSPFVISSCPGARVHVLDVDEKGHATARPPEDAPVGQSVYSTIKDVFDVDSRFDVNTERDLKRWNDLRRKQAVAELSAADKKQLAKLTAELAARSGELALIVGIGPKLPPSEMKRLLQG